jgi:very-short-patch-repair endonuclease
MNKNSFSSNIVDLCREQRKSPTEAELVLWKHLRNRNLGGYKFRRQHPIGGYILDFYCAEAKIGIELDGAVHQDLEQIKYDLQRSTALSELGVEVIRFWNSEVTGNCDNVLNQILKKIEKKTK